ncbi:DUF3168 domain-containing protein [Shinella sp.]|uniref:DUF3168 domain-containing protein n=1 Tax=Shinella sp. TaxID=1870904 RepID=UPI0029A1644F|nr:DUF3168 domain-containing protein [Shinella sp.]MDX3975792.1 DUF3168 domain-containing protein [Shinella sp.]
MSPEVAFQKGLRLRLAGTPAVSGLVPATSMLDRNERPAPDPSIILGEMQSIDEGQSIARKLTRIYMDLHIWKKDRSTAGVKAIAGEVRTAVRAGRIVLEVGFHCVDCRIASQRFLRDPGGEFCHGVVTIDALVEETA